MVKFKSSIHHDGPKCWIASFFIFDRKTGKTLTHGMLRCSTRQDARTVIKGAKECFMG